MVRAADSDRARQERLEWVNAGMSAPPWGARTPPPSSQRMGESDEKTRVTAVISRPTGGRGEAPAGNDCLVVIYTKEPALLGRRFVLGKSQLRIGRGTENDIVLEGDSVSRKHAHIEERSGKWWVVDDGSTNGTYVNDERVARHGLNTGDRVKVGPTIFKYLAGEDVETQYHEEIYRMTIIDGLTQAHVKRYLLEVLEKETVRATRYARPLSLLMIDIDHFKRINDSHGHLAGDYVLKELAGLVMTRIRSDEVLARYGGEEFALVLPETDIHGAQRLAEALRLMVSQARFDFQEEHIQVTISIGVAMRADSENATDLIRRADAKLYEAKRAGRNRVMA